MGQRVTQRILVCDLCDEVPEDGEHTWEMEQEIWWCEECCEKKENESEKETE